jgi:hypothetical protein
MNWISVSCPNCSTRIRRKDVRDNFRCPSCGTALASNRTKARWMMFGIGLVSIPLVLIGAQKIATFVFGPGADFSDKQLVAFLLYVGLILLIYPLLLTVSKEK